MHISTLIMRTIPSLRSFCSRRNQFLIGIAGASNHKALADLTNVDQVSHQVN